MPKTKTAAGRPKAATVDASHPLAIRFPAPLVAALDAERALLAEQRYGQEPDRSELVRDLVIEALDARRQRRVEQ